MRYDFTPPRILRNPHVQTSLTSLKPRKLLAQFRAKQLAKHSTEHVLDCGDGVRLLGALSYKSKNSRGIVTLIHGWEGSIDSTYILSAGATLFNHGYNVFRLNLRDHGKSHHLNRELFNSTRLAEVVGAISEIHRLFPHRNSFLAGFSLGANFALRIALHSPAAGIKLNGVAAVCPLINPVDATANLERNHPVYHHYFVRKWQRSLKKKLIHFPNLGYNNSLLQRNSLARMHDFFVPNHTSYRTTFDYLSAYRLTDAQLAELQIPTHIIASIDDPITQEKDLKEISNSSMLSITMTRYGGHCGFLKDLKLNSWADEQLVSIFDRIDSPY